MNTFHYILIGLVLIGFLFQSKDIQVLQQPATTKKARIIMTLVVIALIVISAYW